MEYKQLKFFLQICKDRNFTKAAQNLYITQQGLSKAIKNFEEELGVPLFYRLTEGVRLTPCGMYLAEKARKILTETDMLLADIEHMKSRTQRKITIAFAFGVISALTPDFITCFQNTYPDIEITINEYEDIYCEQAVLDGKADIGFTIAPIDNPALKAKLVKSDKMCLLVNKKNSLSKKTDVDFKDIQNEKIVIVNENFKLYHNFVNRCRKAGFTPNIYLTTKEMILVHKLSSENKGVGVSVYFISTNIPHVIPITFTDTSCTWDVQMITRRAATQSDSVLAFVSYVENIHDLIVQPI